MKKSNVKILGRNLYIEEFRNIQEFVKTLDERPHENSWSEHHEITDEARNLLCHGWSEVSKEIQTDLSKMDNVVTKEAKLKQKIYTTSGYYPNVGKALRGNPRCMGKYKKQKVSTKIVEILWELEYSWSVKPEQVKQQGIKLVKKIKQLEMMGYRVRLSAHCMFALRDMGGVSDPMYMARMTIKEENQPLDIARIAYPLANSGMLRTWLFNWYEHLEGAEYLDGYGVPIYHWQASRKQMVLDALNTRGNQYYVAYNTDIDNEFKALIEGGK